MLVPLIGVLGACAASPSGDLDRGAVHPTRLVVLLADAPNARRVDFDDTSWAPATPPDEFADDGALATVGWYRIHFTVDDASDDLALYLGRVVGAYEVFVDGVPAASAGHIGRHFIAHYGPTELVELGQLEAGPHVIAIRMFDHWVGGLAFDPVRIGRPGPLARLRSADIKLDVLVHGSSATLFGCAALVFLGLLVTGRPTTPTVGGLVVALSGVQWAVYESHLADLIGRSRAWETFDLSSPIIAGMCAAAIPTVHFRLIPRVPRWALGSAACVASMPLVLDPRWALGNGWWSGIWATYALGCLALLVLAFRARRRVAGEPVMQATYVIVVAIAGTEVLGASMAMPPLLRRFLGDALLVAWLVVVAVVGLRHHLREQRALQRFDGELEASQRSERTRIARELHDGVGQELQLAHFQLQKHLRHAGDDAHLEELSVQLRRAMETVRAVSHGMVEETPSGLLSRLEALASEFTRTGPAIVHVGAGDGLVEPLPPSTVHELYRIAQQALTNAVRHAEATEITISAAAAHEELSLLITDDGGGFDATVARGFGLAGMRDRAASFGGTVEIQSSDTGTEVRVSVPLGEPR